MAFLQPPITDDPELDSWTLRLTQQINQGLIPGASGSGGGGGGGERGPSGADGTDGNSSIYLYRRDTQGTTPPARPTDVDYNFNLIQNPVTINDGSGWFADLPSGAADTYLWVTFRYVSGATGNISNANSWDEPVLISVPAFNYVTTIESRNPTGQAVNSDPTGWPITTVNFRNNGGGVKALVANLYSNGVLQSLSRHQDDYTYVWRKNGVGTFPSTTTQRGDSGQTSRVLLISAEDVADSGEDAFTCELTFP